MSVRIAGIDFDNVFYDREVDVLYLHVGAPESAVDWSDTEEGDGVRYGSDGEIVGITILNARARLEEDGELVFTLPTQRVVATDLNDALTPA